MRINRYTLQIVFVLSFFLVSYGVYFLLERETAIQLSLEDGLFETLTALSFLGAVYFFFRSYWITKNLYFALLVVIFFFGAGEEISWGQRYFGFDTPAAVKERNIQKEFNLHNIDIFHPQDAEGSKSGLEKFLTIDFLYNIFWLLWCIIIPVVVYIDFFDKFFKKIKLPIPPLSIGIFFLLNFAIFVLLRSLITEGKADIFYMKLREVFECCSAITFLTIARTFHFKYKLNLNTP